MIDRLVCPTLALCAALLVLACIIDWILCWGAALSDETMEDKSND